MNTTLTWKPATGRYASGETAYIGRWPVFSTCWDGTGLSENKIKLYCKLPGIKSDLGNFPDWDDAKKKADAVMILWIEGMEEC